VGMFDFVAIKRSLKSVEDRVKAMRAEIAALEAEKAAIARAPTTKADLLEHLQRFVNEARAQYIGTLSDSLNRLSRDPATVSATRLLRPMSLAVPGGMSADPVLQKHLDLTLCGLLGPALMESLSALVAAMDLPEAGLPFAQRQAELDRIDGRIRTLSTDVAALISEAQAAGIYIE
jgi:hypothetical protein